MKNEGQTDRHTYNVLLCILLVGSPLVLIPEKKLCKIMNQEI